MNKANYIDAINLVLILFAAFLSFLIPFQTFVIAYLVIGPLHYLTEAQWLKEKDFFIENKKWGIALIVSAVLLMTFIQLEEAQIASTRLTAFFDIWSNAFIYLAFLLSAILVLVRNNRFQLILFSLGFGLLLYFNDFSTYHILIGILLPTVIHVYLFTLLFMAYGWKKQQTKTGFLNIVLLAISPAIIFLPSSEAAINSGFFNDLYLKTGFQNLNIYIENWFGLSPAGVHSNTGYNLKIQSFLAFVYLYHYLNWFSKTSQIKWHKAIKSQSAIVIGVVWAIIIALYFIRFEIGLIVAIFFSYTHVFLEFPLNVRTINSLFKK